MHDALGGGSCGVGSGDEDEDDFGFDVVRVEGLAVVGSGIEDSIFWSITNRYE